MFVAFITTIATIIVKKHTHITTTRIQTLEHVFRLKWLFIANFLFFLTNVKITNQLYKNCINIIEYLHQVSTFNARILV